MIQLYSETVSAHTLTPSRPICLAPRSSSPPLPLKKVLTLRRAGHTKAQIRDAVGISEDAVGRICAQHRDTLPAIKPGNRKPAPTGAR